MSTTTLCKTNVEAIRSYIKKMWSDLPMFVVMLKLGSSVRPTLEPLFWDEKLEELMTQDTRTRECIWSEMALEVKAKAEEFCKRGVLPDYEFARLIPATSKGTQLVAYLQGSSTSASRFASVTCTAPVTSEGVAAPGGGGGGCLSAERSNAPARAGPMEGRGRVTPPSLARPHRCWQRRCAPRSCRSDRPR